LLFSYDCIFSPLDLHSFPTRRSSDLFASMPDVVLSEMAISSAEEGKGTFNLKKKRSSWASGRGYVPSISSGFCVASTKNGLGSSDRKSTRLNSSHRTISYAVFCLKKK